MYLNIFFVVVVLPSTASSAYGITQETYTEIELMPAFFDGETSTPSEEGEGRRFRRIFLTLEQRNIINTNRQLIQHITDNYWKDLSLAKRDPLLNLTTLQEELISETYGFFFSPNPPNVPNDVLRKGEGLSEKKRKRRSTLWICPAETEYQQLQFAVNENGTLLQMVQLGHETQWTLTETCDTYEGIHVTSVVCLERMRTVPAIVIDFNTAEVEMQNILVTACAGSFNEGGVG